MLTGILGTWAVKRLNRITQNLRSWFRTWVCVVHGIVLFLSIVFGIGLYGDISLGISLGLYMTLYSLIVSTVALLLMKLSKSLEFYMGMLIIGSSAAGFFMEFAIFGAVVTNKGILVISGNYLPPPWSGLPAKDALAIILSNTVLGLLMTGLARFRNYKLARKWGLV